mmetsp:Transcript_94007/g.265456  ORF Transcript_94007/g.265456 Transcript_94007/m.265456 type:complete len:265 (+) Transcript_94007:615-1409(+)
MRDFWVSRPSMASLCPSVMCCKRLMYFAIFVRKATASSRKVLSIFCVEPSPSWQSTCTTRVAASFSESCCVAHSRCSNSFVWKKLISCFVVSFFLCSSPRFSANRSQSCSYSCLKRSISARNSECIFVVRSVKSRSMVISRARSTLKPSSRRLETPSKVTSVLALRLSTRPINSSLVVFNSLLVSSKVSCNSFRAIINVSSNLPIISPFVSAIMSAALLSVAFTSPRRFPNSSSALAAFALISVSISSCLALISASMVSILLFS